MKLNKFIESWALCEMRVEGGKRNLVVARVNVSLGILTFLHLTAKVLSIWEVLALQSIILRPKGVCARLRWPRCTILMPFCMTLGVVFAYFGHLFSNSCVFVRQLCCEMASNAPPHGLLDDPLDPRGRKGSISGWPSVAKT